MTPYYEDDWLTVYLGDCREVMAAMPAESVHCVVTSPPYWGLRDYGTATWVGGDEGCDHLRPVQPRNDRPKGTFHGGTDDGDMAREPAYKGTCGKCGAIRQDSQLGLEPTPEQYVENMVAVFREVRRVLRPDGTVWLNLGASFMNSGPSGPQGHTGQRASRTFTAAGLGSGAVGASGPSPSRRRERAPSYGTDGTGPLGSTAPGSAYSDLCDGCRDVLSPRSPDTLRPRPDDALPLSQTDRDTERSGSGPASPGASPLDAQASTTQRSEQLPPGSCSHCGACGACLSVLRSSSRDARECVRRSWLNYPTFKPKDMVPIPWMVAMALQADGWYLRSDIIWSKPNPMPESVTDRPTKSHEYLFLLSKSPRYYYDADAVREGFADERMGNPGRYRWTYGEATGKGSGDSSLLGADGVVKGWNEDGSHTGRNIRSVWTIATQPYPGAHFATFPRKLVEPCIKAGCPTGGVVLDPFAGSGTTGLVAQSLSRRAVLIDLNADYLEQVMDRNRAIPLGLLAVTREEAS